MYMYTVKTRVEAPPAWTVPSLDEEVEVTRGLLNMQLITQGQPLVLMNMYGINWRADPCVQTLEIAFERLKLLLGKRSTSQFCKAEDCGSNVGDDRVIISCWCLFILSSFYCRKFSILFTFFIILECFSFPWFINFYLLLISSIFSSIFFNSFSFYFNFLYSFYVCFLFHFLKCLCFVQSIVYFLFRS